MSDGRRTELIAGTDGPRLAKAATTDDGRHLLAQELRRLRAARHPGVVELVHHEPDRIELAWAGDRTIELEVFDLDGAAALLAAIASTVADLHDLGVVHGRLDPTHVIIGPDGRPRLCGMSGPRPGEPDPHPSVDVAAIGSLIHRLVGEGVAAEPIPERRWRRRHWSGYHQRSLQNLADQAQAHDAELRPSARTLAKSLAEVVPGARLARPATGPAPSRSPDTTPPVTPTDPTSAGDVDGPEESIDVREVLGMSEPPDASGPAPPPSVADDAAPWRPRWRLVATSAIAAATLVAVAVAANPRSATSSTDEALQPGPITPPDTTSDPMASTRPAPPSTTTTPPPTTTAPRCTPVAGLAADVDDDGCPDPVVIEGTTITAGSTVFRAGEPDDHVTVGDWRCTGVVTPGLVRPTTGEVFLFDRWPDGDAPLEVEPVAIVPGGARLVIAEGSCGSPGVAAAGGALTHLSLTEDQG